MVTKQIQNSVLSISILFFLFLNSSNCATEYAADQKYSVANDAGQGTGSQPFNTNKAAADIKNDGNQVKNDAWVFWSPDKPNTKQLVVLSSSLFEGYVDGFINDWNLMEQAGVGISGINSLTYLKQTTYVQNNYAFEWMKRNIPYFDCPDNEFKEIYYFRHWMNRLHLKNNNNYYVVTEFIFQVSWADVNNVIVCPSGHHFNWLMWLDDPIYAQSYINYYMHSPDAKPKLYRDWFADCAYKINLIHPSKLFVKSVLGNLINSFNSYDSSIDSTFHNMYWCSDWNDGFERQIGGSGIRTTINSYMYGNAIGIAKLAEFMGDNVTKNKYNSIAASIKNNVQTYLWDKKDKFFKTYKNQAGYDWDDKTYGKESWFVNQTVNQLVDVREIIGYIPWQFNLPDDSRAYSKAWSRINNSVSGFKSNNGFAGAQKDHPRYNIPTPGARWNGPTWFYAETQTLVALSNLLNDYNQRDVNKSDYFEALERYTLKSHYNVNPKGSKIRPWATEWVDPDELNEYGCPVSSVVLYYFHSGYTDLIINGLVGIRPQEDNSLIVNPLVPNGKWNYFCLDGLKYKGHYICVIWDIDGTKYGKGKGLKVYVNGVQKASRRDIGRLTISLNSVGE
jgi:hypothetical protein